jgi:hypothetical protein
LVQQEQLLKTSPSESYDEILTPEEIEFAISDAREKKFAKARLEAYWDKIRAPHKPVSINWNEFLEMTITKANTEIIGFNLSKEENEIYQTLAMYFTGSKEFEQRGEGFSLKKGLMVQGNVGSGKTTALKLFSSNPYQSFAIVACRKVQYDFANQGFKGVEKYFGLIASGRPSMTFGHREVGICFDDLGTEGAAKNFGNESNVMADIIQTRYDNEINTGFKTHFTTNLDSDLIEEFYGLRVRSRLREMVNMIVFPIGAEDKRK